MSQSTWLNYTIAQPVLHFFKLWVLIKDTNNFIFILFSLINGKCMYQRPNFRSKLQI